MAPDAEPWFASGLGAAEARLRDVLREVESLRGTLSVAAALHASGRAIDLAGLADRAGLICAQALDLPQAQGRAARPALVSLRAALDSLIATAGTRPADRH